MIIRNTIYFIRKATRWLIALKASDVIAGLALITTVYSSYLTREQFRESQRQFAIQRTFDSTAGIQQDSSFRIQLRTLEKKDSADRYYYEYQLSSSKTRDSFEIERYKGQLKTNKEQRHFAREQFVAQVRPKVIVGAESDVSQRMVGLFISNMGLGPAIFERFSMYFDGREMRDMYDIIEELEKLYPSLFEKVVWYGFPIRKGFTLYPQKDAFIISTQGNQFENPVLIHEILSHITVKYSYRSFAGELYESSLQDYDYLR